MTEPVDHSGTRPISVAELLAKNGNIGSPPVGGRRRRRRGDSDSVTVAELTGEIPVVGESIEYEPDGPQLDAPYRDAPARRSPVANGSRVERRETPRWDLDDDADDIDPAVEFHDTDTGTDTDDDLDDVEADYDAHLERRAAASAPVDFAAPARRPSAAPATFSRSGGRAEQMSPDPLASDVYDDDDIGTDEDLIRSLEGEEPLSAALDVEGRDVEVPSYLRSDRDTLFGGQSMADDLARRGRQPGPEEIDLGADERPDGVDDPARPPSALLRATWVVAQCLLAVIFGAVLFIAFDLLWKWNNVVALVLAVLVILGLVIGVRVVRKTEDVGSTLIAVAVGALVTLGPLALLSSH